MRYLLLVKCSGLDRVHLKPCVMSDPAMLTNQGYHISSCAHSLDREVLLMSTGVACAQPTECLYLSVSIRRMLLEKATI